uniref:IgGFc-binding protein n=1 Tax=Magallana gigas TaxID=29159 RepID=K1PTD1_MAGGI
MNETLQINGKIYRSGETFSIKLNRYETYQIQHTVDLTGTVVQSSSPIAVFSGNDCNKLNGQGFCDHLIEQLPPTSRIDTVYVVPPHLYSNTKIRVMAIDKSTIFYKCTNKTFNMSYKRNEYSDIDISSNGVCYIQSNKHILVTSFGLSSSIRYIGDPSMVIVPGFYQYQNYYKIIVPFGYDYSYITVIMKQSDIADCFINYVQSSGGSGYARFSTISSSINSEQSIGIYTVISNSTSSTYDNISEGFYDRQIGRFITPTSGRHGELPRIRDDNPDQRNPNSNQEHTKDSNRPCIIVILSVFVVVILTTVATIAVLYLQGQDSPNDNGNVLSLNRSFLRKINGTEIFSDCKDLKLFGNNSDGLYTVYPDPLTETPIVVYCDMTTDGGGWTDLLYLVVKIF